MDRNSQLDLFQKFIQKQDQRTKIQIGGQVEAIFDYCQYIIHTEYDKKSKTKFKFKQRKNMVSDDFMRAFATLQREDKISYYNKNVIYLLRLSNGDYKAPRIRTEPMLANVYTKSYNIGRWKLKKMRLDSSRQVIFGEKNNTIKQYDLGDYIFRGSKNTKFYTFVLQAIKQSVHNKMKTVHMGFQSAEQMQDWADAVQRCIDFKHWQRIYIQLFKKPPPRQSITQKLPQTTIAKQPQMPIKYEQKKQNPYQPVKYQAESKIPVQATYSLNQNNNDDEFEQFQSDSGKQEYEQEQDEIVLDDEEDSPNHGRTIIQDLVEGQGYDSVQVIQSRNKKENSNLSIRNLNIFHKMFPQFQFNQVQWEGGYQMIHNQQNMRIMQNSQQKQRYKLVYELTQSLPSVPLQSIFKSISSIDFMKGFNDNILESSIKTFISSENAAIMYMVLKQFNRIYRPRDFLFIRHCFRRGLNELYIADKDIQNTNYPPFITIVRGKYQGVWAIIRKGSAIKLIGSVLMDNSGYLNDNQNTNLVINFLRGFIRLPQFVSNNIIQLKQFNMFESDWDITKNKQNQKQNQLRIKRKTQKIKAIKPTYSTNNIQSPISNKNISTQRTSNPRLQKPQVDPRASETRKVEKQREQQKLANSMAKQKQLYMERQKMISQQVDGQIDPKDLQNSKLETNSDIKLRFDENGMVIVQKGFIKTRYQLVPTKNYPLVYWPSPAPGIHPIWTTDWKHDVKRGGLFFINQKKMDDQKNVIKFILSKIGKNLLSGKSILNISLPVDIFTCKSNLQLFIQSLCYAPILLQKASKLDSFSKYKLVTAVGVSMSCLYLIMQKPFNPILGETFQAWINGCPAYAQQISHHPPICSLLLYGRGYTISGQFQSKAEVHMNSGTGTNDGIFRFNFDDGTRICFCSGGGEVSGLTYGDRKFNVQGKAYSWSETENYFSQIVYNPTKKGFFSMKKQQQPQDFFEGQVYKVSNQFISSLYSKRKAATQKDITSSVGKFNGTWHQETFFDQQILLDIKNQLPCKLEYQKNPLPSDSNWREDIAYRRLMQVTRAQTQKQRLENFQRADRKLRQKYSGKSH